MDAKNRGLFREGRRAGPGPPRLPRTLPIVRSFCNQEEFPGIMGMPTLCVIASVLAASSPDSSHKTSLRPSGPVPIALRRSSEVSRATAGEVAKCLSDRNVPPSHTASSTLSSRTQRLAEEGACWAATDASAAMVDVTETVLSPAACVISIRRSSHAFCNPMSCTVRASNSSVSPV